MANAIDTRNVAAAKYFKTTPNKPSYAGAVILAVLGILSTLYSFTNRSNPSNLCFLLTGLVVAGIGGIMYLSAKSSYDKIYKETEPKPSDAQMDEWLDNEKVRIKDDAQTSLGLIPERTANYNEPLLIIGPRNRTKVALGKDDHIRFSDYEVVIVFLTDTQLAAYVCHLDFVNAKTDDYRTEEYPYRHIVAVSTAVSNSNFIVTTVDDKEHPVASSQQFSIVVPGEKITVTTSFPQLEGLFKTGKFLPSGADKAIGTIRARLREIEAPKS